jgi:hypothetical protein
VITQREIERLRARAAHYREKAIRTRQRAWLIYCRALASHLEREAIELEHVVGRASQQSKAPSLAGAIGEIEMPGGPKP